MGRNRYAPYRDQSQSVSSEAEIESKPLQRLIGKITNKWGWGEVVVNCSSPYIPLVHSWSEAMEEVRKFWFGCRKPLLKSLNGLTTGQYAKILI